MNESAFQRACDEFVSREVYCCVSTMTEYILSKSIEDHEAPFSTEDIENPMQSGEFEYDGEWHDVWSIEELEEWKAEKEYEIEQNRETDIVDIVSRAEENYNELVERINDKYDKMIGDLNEACDEAESQLEEYKEILEYWVVSPYLLSKLQERNEAVIESEQIWCRCTSGQAIAIDGVIREIVKEQLIARSEWDEEAKQILL